MITTKRLLLRPVELDEAEAIANLITEKISHWTCRVPWPYSLNDAINWIENSSAEKRLGIFLNGKTLIGTIEAPLAEGEETGFIINEKYENQGYATEALKAVTEYCFKNTDLEYIISSIHPENIASRRVHEKANFSILCHIKFFWPNKNSEMPVVEYMLKRPK